MQFVKNVMIQTLKIVKSKCLKCGIKFKGSANLCPKCFDESMP